MGRHSRKIIDWLFDRRAKRQRYAVDQLDVCRQENILGSKTISQISIFSRKLVFSKKKYTNSNCYPPLSEWIFKKRVESFDKNMANLAWYRKLII